MIEQEYMDMIWLYLSQFHTWDELVRAAFVTNQVFDEHRLRVLDAAEK